MKKIPATIEEHVFPVVRIAANPAFKPPEEYWLDIKPDSVLQIAKVPDNPRRFMTHMRVKVTPENGDNIPYFIDVACFSFITVDADVPDEQTESIVSSLGNMILFPAIRELILSITARQPWGTFSIGLNILTPPDNAAKHNPEKTRIHKKNKDQRLPNV